MDITQGKRKSRQVTHDKDYDYPETYSVKDINTPVHTQNQGQQVWTNDFSHNWLL